MSQEIEEIAEPDKTEDTATASPEMQTPPPPVFSVSSPFEPEIISKLPTMTSDQLSQIEELLSGEFTDLAKKYLQAREARVDSMIDIIDQQIKLCQARDTDWTQHYGSEMNHIERLLNNIEDHILGNTSQYAEPSDLQEFDRAVADLMAGTVLPITLDDIFSTRKNDLPFSLQFQVFVNLYQRHLHALVSYKEYQSHLVDRNAERNKGILWKQYRFRAMEYRQQLIDQTYNELNNLYEEFHGIRDYKIANMDADKYYRAVASIDNLKHDQTDAQYRLRPENIDSYYDIDNRYVKNNRIQVTATKDDALDRINEFESNQSKYTIPQIEDATVRLSGCKGLTAQEVDSDLVLLRTSAKEITVETPELAPEPKKISEFQELLDAMRLPSQLKMEPIEL